MKKIFLILFLASPLMARGPSDPLPNGFQIFPANNVWNTRIDNMPVSSSNTAYMADVAYNTVVPSFGSALYAGAYNGDPYNIICLGVTPNAPVSWESGAYITESATLTVSGLPIPSDAIVQGDPAALDPATDRHLILIDTCTNTGYDIFQASRVFVGGVVTSSWTIISLTTWTYTSNALWPATWTSANAAGTALLPEFVNWNEVNAGAINHAIGFTLPYTHGPYLWPASHDANTGPVAFPPLGSRVRLKASVDISGYSATNQVILTAMKKYGMILVDNGGYWNLEGAPNTNWNDSDVQTMRGIVPSTNTFEFIDESSLMITSNSGQANQSAPTVGHSWSGGFTLKSGGTYQ